MLSGVFLTGPIVTIMYGDSKKYPEAIRIGRKTVELFPGSGEL